MDDLQRVILHVLALHVGPASAITRSQLKYEVESALGKVYKSDRTIREAIEELRSTHRDGAFICALFPSDAEPGYFMGRNEAEVRDFMRPDYARYNHLGERLASQEKLLNASQNGVPIAQIGMAL